MEDGLKLCLKIAAKIGYTQTQTQRHTHTHILCEEAASQHQQQKKL